MDGAATAALATATWLATHLPVGLLAGLADVVGELWYRLTPARAARARRNLGRVCRALSESGRASPRISAAGSDPRSLERLVRSAYRHAARYYVDVARTPGLRATDLDELLALETPDTITEAFSGDGAVIFIGLHFGALEVPALFLASRMGRAVAPMETLGNRALQAWFVRTRGVVGLRIVGLREARRELLAALREGVPVGLVGDRDLTGGGTPVQLFGAPARLPLGPAILAVESGARTYVTGVRRVAGGRYVGRLEAIHVPPTGSLRERSTGTMTSIAAAFERIVADAPDQWWAVFFPIWPDLETAAEASAA